MPSVKQRFCLVLFLDDGIIHITAVKNVKKSIPGIILAPFKHFGLFKAMPLLYHNDYSKLKNLKQFFLENRNEGSNNNVTEAQEKNGFSLVKFLDDGILYVTSDKNLRNSSHHTIVEVPYKNMGLYKAVVILCHKDRKILENQKHVLEEMKQTCKKIVYSHKVVPGKTILKSRKTLKKDCGYSVLQDSKLDRNIQTFDHMDMCKQFTQEEEGLKKEKVCRKFDDTSRSISSVEDLMENTIQYDNVVMEDDSIREEHVNIHHLQHNYWYNCIIDSDDKLKKDGRVTSPTESIHAPSYEITNTEEVSQLSIVTDSINETRHNMCMNTVEVNGVESSSDVFRIANDLDVSISKSGKKRYYCSYCNKTVTNFGRHLVTLHKNQPAVSSIMKYPKGHPERKNRITCIRNAAQHMFNVNPDVNTGKIIVSRRPSKNKHRDASHYRACPNCKQMFSKLSLRVHFNKCSKEKQGARGILLKSKQFQMYVHKNATEILVKFVLAHCREDKITEEIMYDDLCIKFGNKLCKKYRGQQHSNMIRARLKELGKFIMEMKKMDTTLRNLSDILVPRNYDKIVIAINKVAGFDEISGVYRAPSTAYNLGLHLKTVTTLLRSEYIKEGYNEKRTEANDLLCLMNEGFQTDINKMVNENQCQNKRHKKILLPTAADINALKLFLKKGMKEEYDSLKAQFTREAWKNLAGYTLICLVI